MSKRVTKTPTEQDRYAGERIREARIALGKSQTELGGLLGVSFQQVQKYENGSNRVNGARIVRLVSALNRPFNYFYPNATDVRTMSDTTGRALATKEGQEAAALLPLLSPADCKLWLGIGRRFARQEKT